MLEAGRRILRHTQITGITEIERVNKIRNSRMKLSDVDVYDILGGDDTMIAFWNLDSLT